MGIAGIDHSRLLNELAGRLQRDRQISEALADCLAWLATVMPVKTGRLLVYEEDLGAVREVARATPEGAEELDEASSLHRLPLAARIMFRFSGRRPWLITDSKNPDPIARSLSASMGAGEDWCTLVLMLDFRGQKVGQLLLGTTTDTPFTKEHGHAIAVAEELFAGALLRALQYRELAGLRDRLESGERKLKRRLGDDEVVGVDRGLRGVMGLVERVAPLDSPVLLLGETGTGKDVIARAIHRLSGRSGGPMISVNCGAIPETLLDSSLFGHEKGAFTGAAARREGPFERAHGGTIFLDEIGELTLAAQVKLLRVLEIRQFERVGGTRTVTVDVRVVAATHRDIPAMIEAGSFRQDLWFRLNVFPVTIPPLRARKEDIPALTRHFLLRGAARMGLKRPPKVGQQVMGRLLAASWPGNVRELQNVVERGLILCQTPELRIADLGMDLAEPSAAPSWEDDEVLQTLDDAMASHILRALVQTDGRVEGAGGAADLLAVKPSTLVSRMKRLGIFKAKA
jgi:transcriptional regulator with GAF, ATPase, and Fis domain